MSAAPGSSLCVFSRSLAFKVAMDIGESVPGIPCLEGLSKVVSRGGAQSCCRSTCLASLVAPLFIPKKYKVCVTIGCLSSPSVTGTSHLCLIPVSSCLFTTRVRTPQVPLVFSPHWSIFHKPPLSFHHTGQ